MTYRFFFILIIAVLLPATASADVIVLHSGQRVEGRIVTVQEDIIIIETPQGRRFQYLATDVKEVLEDENTNSDTAETPQNEGNHIRKTALRLMLDGGMAFLPNEHTGGTVGAEVAVGSNRIADKKIFLGGSVGYMGTYVHGNTHFIPIQAVVAVPLTQQDNSPEIGMSLGYSIGFRDKQAFSVKTGGLTGCLSVGYRWRFGEHNAFVAGLMTRLQQSNVVENETIEGNVYAIEKGVCYITASVRLQVQF